MSDIPDTTEFKFNLTLGDAKIIVAALGKLPMESVEPTVNKMRQQVDAQMRNQPVEGEVIPAN